MNLVAPAIQDSDTFELLIGSSTPQGYPVTLTRSPAGEASDFSLLNTKDPGLRSALTRIERRETDTRFLIELGQILYDHLLPGPIRGAFHDSLLLSRSRGRSLRLRLCIVPPELVTLPWEYLFCPREDLPLSVSTEIPLVRYVPLSQPIRPTAVEPPLRLLVVISNPMNTAKLQVDQERESIEIALADGIRQGLISAEYVEDATIPAIGKAMRRVRPHVFHFVGHGRFQGGQASIILEDETQRSRALNEREVGDLFLGVTNTRVAVLNACKTATASSTRPLSGLAPRLLARQLSAVVAMQNSIPDHSARIFAREFYHSLALGYPVDAAMAEARRGIYQEQGSKTADWGIPVLYLRADDARLFQVQEVSSRQDSQSSLQTPPPPVPSRPPELEPFVGRSKEMDYFAGVLERRHLAVITGMPGVGKTALAVKLANRHAADRVFWHAFHDGEGIDVIIWKLSGFLAWHGQPDLWQMLQGAQQTGGRMPPTEMLFDYLLQMLSGHGYLLCFDDFHFIHGDARLDQAVSQMRPALARGDIDLVITSQRLPPFVRAGEFEELLGLDLDDTAELFAQHGLLISQPLKTDSETMIVSRKPDQLPIDLVKTVHARTEGNPCFLVLAVETFRRYPATERFVLRLYQAEDVERFLVNTIDAHLTDDERAVMSAVSTLLGQEGTRDAIETVLDGGSTRRPLKELFERNLLGRKETSWGRAYCMNAIVRHFYYNLLSRREKRAMHLRAGEFYETEEPEPLKAARHLERAGEYQRAAKLATEDSWTLINQGQTLTLCNLLEKISQRQLPTDLWAAVRIAQGHVYTFLRSGGQAVECYLQALSALNQLPTDASTRASQARACRGLGAYYDREDPQKALVWLQRGLEVLEGASPVEEAALLVGSGGAQIALGEYARARESVQRALKLLPPGREDLRISALISMGTIYSCQGDIDRGRTYTLEALKLCRVVNNHFKRLTALSNLGTDKYMSGDWHGAAQNLGQALGLALQLGNVEEQVRIRNNLGTLQTHLGDHATAYQTLTLGLQAARNHGLRHDEMYFAMSLAELYIEQEQWQAARGTAREAEKLAEALGARAVMPQVYAFQALVELAAGSLEGALERARLGVGEAAGMEASIERAICLRVEAQALYALSQPDEAWQAFENSLALLDDLAPYEAAWTRLEWGRALMAQGESGKASPLLAAARDTFAHLGAARALASATSILEKIP